MILQSISWLDIYTDAAGNNPKE